MADAAVGVFLGLAKDLVAYNYNLISGVKDDFQVIYEGINGFKAFLHDATGWRDSASMANLAARMRDVTYEAEDAIETYVILKYGKGTLERLWEFKKLHNVAEDFKSIKDKIKRIKDDQVHVIQTLQRLDSTRRLASGSTGVLGMAQGDQVVGLDEETVDLIDQLTRDSDERKVVAIAGMPGLGKTTLANKVFTDPHIELKFMYRVWVRVSQQYSRREVLRTIWHKVGDGSLIDPNNITEDELSEKVREHLAEKHCLIALDDIWTDKAWNELQNAFPRENSNLRILVTTRENSLAFLAQEGKPFPLKLLDETKSFELLEKRVFRKQKCPDHLRVLGQEIAEKCGGLPLAIVIIAGILLQSRTEKRWWEDISKRVTENIAQEDKCREIVRLSYDNLPYHLRACFLYFGIFPQSFQVPVSKLNSLWIAEGLVIPEEGIELEEQASKYLQELVDRNLVMVEKTDCTNKIKLCRVHDVLHDLCIKESRQENLFNQIRDLDHFNRCSRDWDTYRRLSIHNGVLEYLALKASGARVRSFLSLGPEAVLPVLVIRNFPGAFQLLRVLDVTSILLQRFPKLLPKLVHLRYVAMYIDFDVLSSDVSKLSKMQVLIVKVNKGNDLEIGANIWDMYQLRHLQTNVPLRFSFPLTKLRQGTTSPIRTLTVVSPETCTAELLATIPRVKKLGIHGDLRKLPGIQGGVAAFDGFSTLSYLEILKIKNESTELSPSPLTQTCYPRSIRQLTLTKTHLDWQKHMNTLETLPNLVVLKLKDSAFIGKYWKPKKEGFLCLEVFHVEGTDLEVWDADTDDFPALRTITLRYCDALKGLPTNLGTLPNLQKLDLHCNNPTVAASGKEIQRIKLEQKQEVLFKLYVFP
ncbi:putative late blight resistance protein homolog R1B-14 [Silene latifolia]|uniref:putative late blight resistance protein homolog R1B-14 n=1 Tax=Silene latifolia TaxID=37657 RepID=UPI003D784FE1